MINKKIVMAVLGLSCMGVVAGLSSSASAINCSTPALPAPNGSTDLLSVGSIITVGCAGENNEVGEMESLGTAGGVRARLISGDTAETFGFNSARQLLNGCRATDTSTGAGSVLDTSGCAGVAFKLIIVDHNL